ncbi:hypothetical protein [Catenulispora rubra]|uniref:hypothetical protein n=1 Tax=Catenulispora rubra TaxID=280293 RepID=UPI00189202E7|nr:hypothetical protein [Catenulispora rubra]
MAHVWVATEERDKLLRFDRIVEFVDRDGVSLAVRTQDDPADLRDVVRTAEPLGEGILARTFLTMAAEAGRMLRTNGHDVVFAAVIEDGALRWSIEPPQVGVGRHLQETTWPPRRAVVTAADQAVSAAR